MRTTVIEGVDRIASCHTYLKPCATEGLHLTDQRQFRTLTQLDDHPHPPPAKDGQRLIWYDYLTSFMVLR
jgi:hypothetical protein